MADYAALIRPTLADLEAAGLPAPSLVRTAKMATIEAGDAQRIGHLAAGDQALVKAAVRQCLALVLAD